MKLLSKQSDYALQLVMDLPESTSGEVLSIRDFCQSRNLSFAFMQRIVRMLKIAGIVDSVRGPSGGYFLMQPIVTLQVLDVIHAVEPEFVDSCSTNCKVSSLCTNKAAIDVIQQRVHRALAFSIASVKETVCQQ